METLGLSYGVLARIVSAGRSLLVFFFQRRVADGFSKIP